MVTVRTVNSDRKPPSSFSAARWVCAVSSCLVLFCAATTAWAQETDPDEHYRRGVELAKAGKLPQARDEFRAAYVLRPHARVSYNLAKLSLELGEKREAIKYLHAYLAFDVSALPPEQVAEVQNTLTELEGEARAEQAPKPTVVAPATDSAAVAAGPAPTPTAWAADGASQTGTERPAHNATVRRPPGAALKRPRASLTFEPSQVQHSPLPAVALTSTGAALLIGGVSLWFWNDGVYGDAISEREELGRNKPPSPRDADDFDRAVDYAHEVGRNDERFEAIQRFDILAWTSIGIGLVCTAAGTWMLLNPPESRLTVGARSVGFRW